MKCFICDKSFVAGDGYAFYRDETERICSRCHSDWFGSKLREEHIIQPYEFKPEDSNERE